ncbi:hypothetical protein L2E82_46940 [Cichorium intybus]|uniref:Uncharacterized protein n=1 Tax=Cichorium intybus TaxID=13427 RepID=A0ACB8YUC7_CICIN|nr:hypothetical protein L2E82_46940 [Cichorium intybus]
MLPPLNPRYRPMTPPVTIEDTSRDMNILYQNPHVARLLFGRGFRAGMDRMEQKKLAAKNQKELRDEIRKKDGIEKRLEEAASVFCLMYCPCILIEWGILREWGNLRE